MFVAVAAVVENLVDVAVEIRVVAIAIDVVEEVVDNVDTVFWLPVFLVKQRRPLLGLLVQSFFCAGAQNKSGRTAVYSDYFDVHRS